VISRLFAVNDTLERRIGVQMSPVQWRTHIDLLQSFTQAAEKAAVSQKETPVGGHTSAVLVAGIQPLTLNPPTVLNIPDPSHSETDLSLTDTGSDITIKPVSEERVPSCYAGEVVPSAIAPHEDKSIDSFYSLTEEVDNLNHDVENDVATSLASKNGPSPIPEEESSQQPTSPR